MAAPTQAHVDWIKETTRRLGELIPSRLDRRDAPRPHHKTPCPAKFPEQPDTPCEGVEGHQGPHVARVTVEWEDRAQAPRVP